MSLEAEPPETSRYERSVKTFLASEETDLDLCKQCFWQLRDEHLQCAKKITRWAVLGLTFACVFELLNRGLVNNASVSFIKVTRLSFLLYVMPPLVVLALLNILAFNKEQGAYGKTMEELAKQRFPGLYSSGIQGLLAMQLGTSSGYIPRILDSRRGARSMGTYNMLQITSLLIFYLAFEIYAYIQLFRHSGSMIAAAILSLLVTVALFGVMALFVNELWYETVSVFHPDRGEVRRMG